MARLLALAAFTLALTLLLASPAHAGWVGRTARCLVVRSFSVRPPAEPDVMVSRSSGSPVTMS